MTCCDSQWLVMVNFVINLVWSAKKRSTFSGAENLHESVHVHEESDPIGEGVYR